MKIDNTIPFNPPDEIIIEFRNGLPYVEIRETRNGLYRVQFINKATNTIEYHIDLKSNHWAVCSKEGSIDWIIRVWGINHYYFIEKEMKNY